ncbi:MAG: hypothetical protein QOH23_1735, partial [Gaiellaceae bacterium]|nr:hypothetical protein [Gaiellaceae bacterium]
VHRRVVSDVAPLVVTGPPPVRKVSDPTLYVGQTALEESGSPSRSTSVERKVYDANGKLLYDTRFYSSYRGEMRVIRIGTKPKPGSDQTETTTTTGTTTSTKKPTTTSTKTTTTPRP